MGLRQMVLRRGGVRVIRQDLGKTCGGESRPGPQLSVPRRASASRASMTTHNCAVEWLAGRSRGGNSSRTRLRSLTKVRVPLASYESRAPIQCVTSTQPPARGRQGLASGQCRECAAEACGSIPRRRSRSRSRLRRLAQSRCAGALLGTYMGDTGGKSGRRPARHLQVEASGPRNAASVQQEACGPIRRED